MPLITNEQGEKKESLFLKYEPENNLIIKSHLYKTVSHYISSIKKNVACHEEDCAYCLKNYRKRVEYNYFVFLNGQDGVMDIKPSVFFSINAIERAAKKDKRQMSWLVIKSGQGLDTTYTVSKDDNLSKEDWDRAESEIPTFDAKLDKLMSVRETKLEEAYQQNLDVPTIEIKEKVDSLQEEQKELSKSGLNDEEEVNPDDIPF